MTFLVPARAAATPLPPSPPPSVPDSPSAKLRIETRQPAHAASPASPPPSRRKPDRAWSSSTDGSAVPPRPDRRRPPPAKLEDFELIRVLGKGVAGRVLLVRHTPTRSLRAMKAISKRAVFAHDELAHTMAEFNILRRLSIEAPDTPFVPHLYNAWNDRENFYLSMTYARGGDLATQMEIHGTLGPVRTRFYATDIVEGLELLHNHGIIVRDLKPENILLNEHGHAVLADFGLSKDFGYRGSPKPIQVVAYPNREPLPSWAGAGAGSLRKTTDGRMRVVVDRAHSFVGTAEYLSPEVITGSEYSYAVDCWALGCIIVEGLIGRVPFRKSDDEPLILYDPWYDVLHLPPIKARGPLSLGFDQATYDFVDALLTKDPMRRLTEPYIKPHPYFGNIEWDTVREGGYGDPCPLDLHLTADYDTRYFPKLCLEETPTVDMTTHDGRPTAAGVLSAINDNGLYALAQASARAQLRAFEWSRDDEIADDDEACDEARLAKEPSDVSDDTQPSEPSDPEAEMDVLEEIRTPEPEPADVPVPLVDIAQLVIGVDGRLREPDIDAGAAQGEVKHGTAPPAVPSPPVSIPTTASQTPRPAAAELDGQPVAPPVATPCASPPAKPRPIPLAARNTAPNGQLPMQDRDVRLPTGLPAGGLSVSDMIAVQSADIDTPNLIIRRHQPLAPDSDNLMQARLSVDHKGTVRSLEDEGWEDLDVGNDMVHLPSAPNGDASASGAPPPSSFFTRTRGIGSVLMRRRPSALGLSGLRRQQPSSDSSSREPSPTKSGRLSATPASLSAAARSIEHTKRALLATRLKAFPRRKASQSTGTADPPSRSVSAAASASASSVGFGRGSTPSDATRPTSPVRPPRARKPTTPSSATDASRPSRAASAANIAALFSRSRHTSKARAPSRPPSGATSPRSPRSVAAVPASNSETSLAAEPVADAPPRLELASTPPLEWDERLPDAVGVHVD